MEIHMWREILNPYELAVKELTCKFNHLIKEHHDKGYYSSIECVEGRVKTVVSILDKCQKKGISIDDVTEKIEDLAGIRIICQFVEDIERVVELLHKHARRKGITAVADIRRLSESGAFFLFIVFADLNALAAGRASLVWIRAFVAVYVLLAAAAIDAVIEPAAIGGLFLIDKMRAHFL